jgi:hypothetical protein
VTACLSPVQNLITKTLRTLRARRADTGSAPTRPNLIQMENYHDPRA